MFFFNISKYNGGFPFIFGSSADARIKNLTILGQAPTEIIPIMHNGKEHYLWYYSDLDFVEPLSQCIDFSNFTFQQMIDCLQISLGDYMTLLMDNRGNGLWRNDMGLRTKISKEKVCFIIMLILSISMGLIELYCKANKWNLEESLTVFLYPFFALFMGILMLGTIIVMLCYAIIKVNRTKKLYFFIPCMCIILLLLVTSFFFSERNLREYNFNKYCSDRERIVSLALEHSLVPDDEGCIVLPEELQDEELARGGKIFIVNVQSESGIYFRTFSGLLETSSGYLYITDQKWNHYASDDIILQEKYNDHWYYCATD